MSLKASIPQGMAQIDTTQDYFIVYGQIATSGNYVSHGDTLDLSQLSTYGGGPASLAVPIVVRVWEQPAAGVSASGWAYLYAPGTTQANGVLQLFNGTTEYTGAAAYAGTIPATLYFEAKFASNVDNQ